MILAGAAFMGTGALQAFSAPALAGLRAAADEDMNGEDLLLNYALAAATDASRPCVQVSSRARLLDSVVPGQAALRSTCPALAQPSSSSGRWLALLPGPVKPQASRAPWTCWRTLLSAAICCQLRHPTSCRPA